MKLENLTDWSGIEKFLDKKIGIHDEKNCSGSHIKHSCNHCVEYFHLANYQQEISSIKYKDEKSPIRKWNNSFNDTLEHMKLRYQN